MSYFGLTFYILIWPAIATGVLITLSYGFWKDIRAAKKSGEDIV